MEAHSQLLEAICASSGIISTILCTILEDWDYLTRLSGVASAAMVNANGSPQISRVARSEIAIGEKLEIARADLGFYLLKGDYKTASRVRHICAFKREDYGEVHRYGLESGGFLLK